MKILLVFGSFVTSFMFWNVFFHFGWLQSLFLASICASVEAILLAIKDVKAEIREIRRRLPDPSANETAVVPHLK